MQAQFWTTPHGWQGIKTVDRTQYQLVETNDRSFSERHNYVWRAKDGAMLHLTEEERSQVPDPDEE